MNEGNEKSLYALQSMNPSLEHLMSALVGYRATLDYFGAKFENQKSSGGEDAGTDAVENLERIQLCRGRLAEVEAALLRRPRKIFYAWNLLHQICEDLFLLLNRDELFAEGTQLVANIKTSMLPEASKKEWIAKLEDQLEKLKKPDYDVKNLPEARNLFKMGMVVLNNNVDTLFWDIWSRKLSGLIYTVLLILSLIGFLVAFWNGKGFSCIIANVFLLGAMGGIASGILTSESQYLAKGHFWISTLYYALVRPAQGALAALIMFLLVQGQYLIKIDPPVECKSAIFANCSSPRISSSGATTQNASFIVLNAAPGKQVYLLMLLLLVAGFSGDKILKSVSDKVLSRLFTEAEKTKEPKKAGEK